MDTSRRALKIEGDPLQDRGQPTTLSPTEGMQRCNIQMFLGPLSDESYIFLPILAELGFSGVQMASYRTKIMLVFSVLLLAVGLAQSGLIFNLDNGELCLQSAQCKSECCQRDSGLSLARCAPKAAENQKCSPWHLTSVYYQCLCESGLTCEVDRTIVGTVTNTDYGYCKDPNDP
ncbi:colipase [Gastrophryne carolinensis]